MATASLLAKLIREGVPESTAKRAAERVAAQQRAVDQGFDVNRRVYRGQHSRNDNYNQVMTGFSESIPEVRRGISVSDDTRVADQFAISEAPEMNGAVYPMYTNVKNTFEFRNPEHVKRMGRFIPDDGISYGGQNATKKALLGRVADGGHVTIEQPLVNQAMKDAGFDSTYVREGFDSSAGKMDGLIGEDKYDTINMNVFDGNQLRSVNAQFDPAKRDSANLLASAAGTGVLGAAALAPQEAEARMISSLQALREGEIKAPKNAKTAQLATAIRAGERAVKGSPAEFVYPSSLAPWLERIAYDEEPTKMETVMAIADFL